MGLIQFDYIGGRLTDQGNDQGLVTAAALADRLTGQGFSGVDFVAALAKEVDFPGASFHGFDFAAEGGNLVQGLPIGHPVAPAEGIAAKFPGEAPLDDIIRGKGATGLILIAYDIPLWFRLIHIYIPIR
jgi:hypothetical protein